MLKKIIKRSLVTLFLSVNDDEDDESSWNFFCLTSFTCSSKTKRHISFLHFLLLVENLVWNEELAAPELHVYSNYIDSLSSAYCVIH